MKKIILFLSFLVVTEIAHAGIIIDWIVDKSNSDPTSGKISLSNTGCGTYNGILQAKTNQFTSFFTLTTNTVLDHLPADMYEIKATNSIGCVVELTFEIKNCHDMSATVENLFVCNGHSTHVKIFPSGGITPYQYKWYNNSGVRIDVNPSGLDSWWLEVGKYYIVVTDQSGCEFRKDFEVKGFNIDVSAKSEYYCFTQNKVTITVKNSKSREYIYTWSDGFVDYGYETSVRIVDNSNSINWRIKVKDKLTSCENEILNISGFERVNQNQKYSLIHSVKHDKYNNNQGSITLLLESTRFGNSWYVDVYRNGLLIRPNVLFSGYNARISTISNLGIGNYRIDIKDPQKCLINTLYQTIYSCGEGGNFTMTDDFQLPPSKPGAYFKVNIIGNPGGPCTYSWFLNDYYRLYTDSPELNQSQLLSLNYPSVSSQICVRAYCPCGEYQLCEFLDPCDNSESKKQVKYNNKEIPSFCYKVLPGGKEIKHGDKTGTIKLDIDLTQKFSANSKQGLPLYNYRLKNVYWEDINVINKSVNGNILHIERFIDEEITTSKTYRLIFIDGNGCTSVESYEVKNTIEVIPLSDCGYRVKCNGEIVETVSNKRLERIGSECEFKIFCGNVQTGTDHGIIYKGEFSRQDPFNNENCFYFEYCIYRVYGQTITNTIYSKDINPDIVKKDDYEYAFVYRKEIETSIPCCTIPTPDLAGNPTKETVVDKLIGWNNLEFNYFDIIPADAENTCVIAYRCLNGYYKKIFGVKNGVITCDLNGICYEITNCIFNVGGYTINNNEYDFNTHRYLYPKIATIARKIIPCPQGENDPCPITFSDPIIRSSKNSNCKVFSNPFGKELTIHCANTDIELPISIELYDLIGRSIYSKKLISSTKDLLLNIPTHHLTSGVYFIKINVGLDSYFEKLIKQN